MRFFLNENDRRLKLVVFSINLGILCIIAVFFGNLSFFGVFVLLIFEEIYMLLLYCLKCNFEYIYEDNGMYICSECVYEWNDVEFV